MLLQGTLKGAGNLLSTEDFLKYLAEQVPGGHYFMVRPPQGIIMTGAVDWRAVLPDASLLGAVAGALWHSYEHIAKTVQAEGVPASSGIFVQLKNEKGEFDQFVIGKEVKERAALEHRLAESARILHDGDGAAAGELEVRKTVSSGFWTRIERG